TNKQKYGSNFTSRLKVCLTAHEAENLTPRKDIVSMKIYLKGLEPNTCMKIASTISAKRKKGQRGKYRSLELEKKTMDGLFKLDVDIPDFVLQAVGKIAKPLVNFCGYVVRTTTFMNGGDWRDVFAKHDCGDTLEERINNPPANFLIESWKACCAKFDDEKFKKRSLQNSKNRRSDKWTKHTIGNLSFPEVEHILTETNGNVLPDPDVVWLAEHTILVAEGVLKWTQLHQLVKDKDKEPEGNESRPQTQEEMLLHVLSPNSGYTQGKGNGYRGSAKVRQQEEQQKIFQNQQAQISNLQNLLEANRKAIDDYKQEQRQNMAAMEKRFMEMITRNNRCDDNL
ncbi:Protein translocase subunit SecA, partial [Bienertia sinuspersici]